MFVKKKTKAITAVEIMIIIIIIGGLTMLLYWCIVNQLQKSRRQKCMANLKQIGTSMVTYVQDYGYNVRYPDANGGGFIARLYQANILQDPEYYLCPGTEDVTNPEKLKKLREEDKDSINATSYAGRMNKNQIKYPGMFRLCCECTTSLVSDDSQGDANHENGKRVCLLFRDGHVESFIDGQKGDYDDQYNRALLLDPLTN